MANTSHTLHVVDAVSGVQIPDAIVSSKGHALSADQHGDYRVVDNHTRIDLRAYGYRRQSVQIDDSTPQTVEVILRPITPRAVYLSVYGVSEAILRDPVFELINKGFINSVVIDVKSDRGVIPYKTSIPLAQEVGADTPLLAPYLPDLISKLHARGVYTIARIVVFKDDILARARPALAIKRADGTLWHDREGVAWTAPYNKQVWDYNIAVATEAARMGFDEIQFDYIRFPDESGPRYDISNTEENRTGSIEGFLKQARESLAPYNVFLSADIFGYVLWNSNDTYIGQRLHGLAPLLDYLSPLLYPSGFQHGIPGYPNPVEKPYEIVYYTLQRAIQRLGIPPVRFRPWLQAFGDYAFDKRAFTYREIDKQTQAADDIGTNGWMLWNPRNVYSTGLFRSKPRQALPEVLGANNKQ